MIYAFGDYELDIYRYELRRSGEPLHIEPKVFELLSFLTQHHGDFISKDQLHAHLWPDQFVSESALSYYLTVARKAIGDSGRAQRLIKTIYGRGYCFIAPVEEHDREVTPSPQAPPPLTEAPEPIETPLATPPELGQENVTPDLETSLPEADRRQLTVLWGRMTLVSTDSEPVEPEDVHNITQEADTLCAAIIQRFEGYVAQHFGDRIMLYFGYPQAHEDDARRAVYTALEIVRTLRQLAVQLEQSQRIRLTIRVGIHTGLAVVGSVGSPESRRSVAHGNTPHIATQLGELGEPNTVIMSQSTQHLVEGYIVGQALGSYVLEGESEPIQAYQVLRESNTQSRLEVAALSGLTPFVGRQQEVALLQARWEQAAIGMGQVVLLNGDAGIGKSRLLYNWSEQLPDAVHTRIECRYSPYTRHSMLYPVLEHLQHALQFEPEDTPEDKWSKLETWLDRLDLSREEVVPLLARWFSLTPPERYASSALSLPQQKQKMFEALLLWLLDEAEVQPVCFVMEDLHWADSSTLDWLDFLLLHIPTSRILFLLTCRPAFHPPWPPSDYIAYLTLNRLSPPQVEAMIREVTDGKALPSEILPQLMAKADGVPLFVEELTRMVLESGVVKERDGRYELADTPQRLTIPSTLNGALAARLDQLEIGKHTVQLGATIGREFSYDLIRAVSQLDDIALQQELAQLVGAALLYQRGLHPQAQYHFKHALIQEAAYQSLFRSTRRQYHQDIAHVLEAQFPERCESQPEILAYHYTESALPAMAVVYWQRAARQAFERTAFLDAEAHVQQGLLAVSMLPDTAERDQYELALQTLLATVLIYTKSFGAPEVIPTLRRAHDLCEQVGDIPQLFSALRSLWLSYLVQGQLATTCELGERLLVLAQQKRDSALLMEAHRDIGTSLFFLGEQTTASWHFAQGLIHNKGQSSPALTFLHGQGSEEPTLLSYQAWNEWLRGYPDQALQTMEQALQLAQPHNRIQSYTLFVSQCFTLLSSATLHQWRREPDAAYPQVESSLVLANKVGFPLYRPRGLTLQGWVLAQRGQPEAGIALIRRGIADYRAQGADLTSPFMLAMLAEIYGQTGEIEAGLDALTEALDLTHTYDERWWEADLYRLQAELLLQLDEPDASQAEAILQQALTVAREQETKALELRAATSLGRLWYQQGKREQAHRLVEDIYSWFTEGYDTVDLKDAREFLSA